jgi:predicted Zn-dependent peptidase
MKNLFSLFFAVLLYLVSPAQYLLVENYIPKDVLDNGQPNNVKIPFAKYTYNNGLTLIISEDHSNPLVNVNITYKVGSANDYADRTGMTYMVYKLMDKGTKHLRSNEYQNTIKQYGGKTYSQITRDFTSFSATVPKNILATVLLMESDRQAYFLDSLTQEKFDNAKLQIIGHMYDSLYRQKYGLSDVLAQKNLYVFGHPYTWPEFGMMDHYQAFSITDFKKFYLDWFGANNTIITITGDVKTQNVLELVNKYFGLLTRAPQTAESINEMFNRIAGSGGVEYTEPRYISYKIDVPYPMVKIVFNTVPRFNPDEKALNIIAQILGQGENSILFNELVKKGYAVKVNARHYTYKHTGEFIIDVYAKPDTSLAVIVSKVNTLLNDLMRKKNLAAFIPPPSQNHPGFPIALPMQNTPPRQQTVPPPPPSLLRKDEKQGNKPIEQPRNIENHQILPDDPQLNQSQTAEIIIPVVSSNRSYDMKWLESLQNKGMALAEREMISGKPAEVSQSLNDYSNITPGGFFQYISKYLMTGAKLYVSIVPKNQEYLIAAKDNVLERELKTIIAPTLEKDLTYRYPVKEINTKKPKIASLAYQPALKIITDSCQSNLKLNLVTDTNTQFVGITIRMDASEVMKQLPQIDVTRLIADKYTEWFGSLGMGNPLKAASLNENEVTFRSDNQYIDIKLTFPKELMMMAKETVHQFLLLPECNINVLFPAFIQAINDTAVIKKYKKQNPGFVLKNLSDNPETNLINTDSLTRKSRATFDMKKLTMSFIRINTPENMNIITYGNVDPGVYVDFKVRLSNWQPQTISFDGYPATSSGADTEDGDNLKMTADGNIFFMQDENSENTTIMLEYMQIPVEVSSDFYTGQFANYILSLSSSSIISKKLASLDYIKNVKGFYYVRNMNKCFAIIATVKPDMIFEAYNVLFKELENFKLYKSDKKEFNNYKNQYLYKYIVSNETNVQKEQTVKKLTSNNIPADIVNNQFAYTKKIKASSVAKFWKARYDQSNVRIVVVGNEDQLQNNLSKTGNTIIKIDNSGNILKPNQ